jgi:hypothetical protein
MQDRAPVIFLWRSRHARSAARLANEASLTPFRASRASREFGVDLYFSAKRLERWMLANNTKNVAAAMIVAMALHAGSVCAGMLDDPPRFRSIVIGAPPQPRLAAPNVIGTPKSVPTVQIAPTPSTEVPPSFVESADTIAKPACPTQNFAEFVEAFAESTDVQKQQTRVPLVYGRLNAELLGTERENEAFTRRRIKSFETIPLFDPDDGGRVFFSKVKRTKHGLEIGIGAILDEPERATTATVFLPDTGFRLIYRFIKTEDCFALIGIDDRST